MVVRLAGAAALFAALAFWEWRAPRRKLSAGRWSRWPGNLGILMIDVVVVRLLVPTAAVGFALLAADRGWGLFHLLSCPIGRRWSAA
jgi:hypothetical protein